MTTCADCGKVILPQGRTSDGKTKWAHQFGKNWVFTCRAKFKAGRMLSADYHHPEGEEQRHFVARPPGGYQAQ